MSFGDVSTAAGLQKLDSFLLDKAYVAGWTPSQEDVKVFQSIKSSPDGKFNKIYKYIITMLFIFIIFLIIGQLSQIHQRSPLVEELGLLQKWIRLFWSWSRPSWRRRWWCRPLRVWWRRRKWRSWTNQGTVKNTVLRKCVPSVDQAQWPHKCL